MAFDKTNTGVLFINKDRKSDKSPNFSGRINVNGTDYELVGWTKVGKSGDKYISLAVDEPRQRKEDPKPVVTPEPEPVSVEEIDDIPFNTVP